EHIFFVYAVEEDNYLVGSVDLRTLLTADPKVSMRELADKEVVTVAPEMDQEHVAQVFARYDLTALPVVDGDHRLLGVITADDVIDVVQEEAAEDVAHMSFTDEHSIEYTAPPRTSTIRMPWIMA